MSGYPHLLGQVAEVGWSRIKRTPRDPTKTAVRYLYRFCAAFGVEHLPLSETTTTVFLYLVWKIRQVDPDTLSRYLSHIRAFYYDIGIRLTHVVGRGRSATGYVAYGRSGRSVRRNPSGSSWTLRSLLASSKPQTEQPTWDVCCASRGRWL